MINIPTYGSHKVGLFGIVFIDTERLINAIFLPAEISLILIQAALHD